MNPHAQALLFGAIVGAPCLVGMAVTWVKGHRR